MKKTFGKKVLVVLVITMMVPGTFTACSNGTTPKKEDPLNATVSFLDVEHISYPAAFIDFSPVSLPVGVTYVLTDDKGNSWNSTTPGFTGKVTANGTYSVGGDVTFIQTFYYNGEKITGAGSQRTVVVTVATFGGINFGAFGSDSGSVTLVHP